MEEIIRNIDRLQCEQDIPRIRVLPGYYRLEFSRNGVITDNKEILAEFTQWMNYMPFVHISSRYHGDETYGGISIEEKYADFFGLKESEYVQHLPGGIGISILVS